MSFYQEGRKAGDFEYGIELALRRLLASPQFLVRLEREPDNLAPGQTTDFLPAMNTPACSDAFGNPENPNEPDTATITCQTGGTPVTASDTASFSCLAVDLTVDRAVNCGPGFADNTQVRANDDTTLGCTAVDGDPVNWKYKACNAGTARCTPARWLTRT
jgi:hypothetical protein